MLLVFGIQTTGSSLSLNKEKQKKNQLRFNKFSNVLKCYETCGRFANANQS